MQWKSIYIPSYIVLLDVIVVIQTEVTSSKYKTFESLHIPTDTDTVLEVIYSVIIATTSQEYKCLSSY